MATLIEKAWEYAYTVFKDNTYEEKMIAKKAYIDGAVGTTTDEVKSYVDDNERRYAEICELPTP